MTIEIINKTKEISDKIPSTPIILTSEQIDEDYEIANRIHKDYLNRQSTEPYYILD